MTNMQQFFEQGGAIDNAGDQFEVESGFVSPLSELSLIELTGDDAASFLHNQLTNDVEHLGLNEARLAAYCSPKGRMLASLYFWKTTEGIFLQLSNTLQPAIQKRLQMFVMRAKAKLSDVSGQYRMLGIGGASSDTVLQQWFPQLPTQVHAKVDNDFGTLIRVADAFGFARYQWIAKNETLECQWPTLQEKLTLVSAHWWRLAEIMSGTPHITEMTQDKFVPQMVNFELIGGVNFKKGCYPGQEIVARSQYLGKLKRRMAIARCSLNDLQAGAEVFSKSDPSQPCGMIVNAIASPNGTVDGSVCLVELKLADLEAGEVYVGLPDGPALQFLPLPYPVLDVTQ